MKNKTLSLELEKWFNKWHRKVVTGRCLIELKNMNKEFIKKLKEELQKEWEQSHFVHPNIIDKLAGDKLI